MKLIKVKNEFYITEDCELEEGDYFLHDGEAIRAVSKSAIKMSKITWSTCPLQGVFELNKYEIADLIGEVSPLKLAMEYGEFFNSNSGYQMIAAYGHLDGFIKHEELNKDKLYTEEDLKLAYLAGYDIANGFSKVTCKEFIEQIRPKTQWDVEIVNEKPKLL